MDGAQSGRAVARGGKRAAHKACIRRLVEEACNGGNLAVLEEVLAPSAPPGDPDALGGPAPQRVKELLAQFRAVVPDARWTIEELIALDDTVVARLSVRGTFRGALVGLAPPGRPATLTGVVIGHFAGDRIADLWLQADLLGLLQQLGVMPQLDLAQTIAMAQVVRADALLRRPIQIT